MDFVKLYLISLGVFFPIDLLWLGVIAKNIYKEEIGHLMAQEIRWGAGVLFYALYLFGLVFFAVWPAVREASWGMAVLYGGLFGLLCYATYDLTNLATLKGWPVKIVVYDLIWGTFISGLVSLITYWAGRLWIHPSL